jgi:transcription elongation factor Elf1
MTILTKLVKLVHNPKVSSKNGQRITDWEHDFFLKWGRKTEKWRCPNCESDFLVGGPEGGASQNLRCRTCGQGYNTTPFGIDNIGVDESWIDERRLRARKLKKLKSKM